MLWAKYEISFVSYNIYISYCNNISGALLQTVLLVNKLDMLYQIFKEHPILNAFSWEAKILKEKI